MITDKQENTQTCTITLKQTHFTQNRTHANTQKHVHVPEVLDDGKVEQEEVDSAFRIERDLVQKLCFCGISTAAAGLKVKVRS